MIDADVIPQFPEDQFAAIAIHSFREGTLPAFHVQAFDLQVTDRQSAPPKSEATQGGRGHAAAHENHEHEGQVETAGREATVV